MSSPLSDPGPLLGSAPEPGTAALTAAAGQDDAGIGSAIAFLDEHMAIIADGQFLLPPPEQLCIEAPPPEQLCIEAPPPPQGHVEAARKLAVPKSSQFHGVTRLKWSGKYEAHLWDNLNQVEGRKRKGKHVYLGSHLTEENAARAHDLAALKYWGPGPNTKLNFPAADYQNEIKIMETMTQDEYVAYIRRRSSCFSRGSSTYRGVTRRKDGKWQARIGKVIGSRDTKDIYLGTYETEESAAQAYDIAAIKLRGLNAVTNFALSDYLRDEVGKLDSSQNPSLAAAPMG